MLSAFSSDNFVKGWRKLFRNFDVPAVAVLVNEIRPPDPDPVEAKVIPLWECVLVPDVVLVSEVTFWVSDHALRE